MVLSDPHDALSAKVKAELPLKRIWTVAADDAR
jgi:hypothetical protein